jgi:lysozyme
MNLEPLQEMLKRNEGVRRVVYRDSLGIATIGVGFNLERADARDRLKARGLDPGAVKMGKAALTDADIDFFLDKDLEDCVTSLRTMLPAFDDMPVPAQKVLVDMRFQLGESGLKAFKNTLGFFRAAQWGRAAANMRVSLAYKQTPERWERNCKILESI